MDNDCRAKHLQEYRSKKKGLTMIVAVAGKNDIGVEILGRLLRSRDASELRVVCNKTETGRDGWQRSLRLFAQRAGVPECDLEDLYGVEDLVLLSMEFDRILKPERFASDRLYNIHFSLLPRYKGMYTSALPILYGEEETGVTLHRIDRGIDTGDIIAQKSFPLLGTETARDVYLKYIEKGIELVSENLEALVGGDVESAPQPKAGSTYYSRSAIDYENLTIDLNQTADTIDRQIRAFSFREYQLPVVHGRRIVGTRITGVRSTERPGTVIFENEGSLMVSTIDYNTVLFVDRLDELMDACASGDLGTVTGICAAREHVNARNDKGWTPLIVAAYNNRLSVVEHLLSVGADPAMTGYNGTTLLMYAKDACLRTGSSEVLDFLLSLGLDCTQRDNRGKDVFDYVEEGCLEQSQREALLKKLGKPSTAKERRARV